MLCPGGTVALSVDVAVVSLTPAGSAITGYTTGPVSVGLLQLENDDTDRGRK